MDNRLWVDKPPQYFTKPLSGQLSLLPSVGREISTIQSEVTFCGPGVKAGLFHFRWKYGWQVKLR